MEIAFPSLVYVLCFLTSAACAWLLLRNFGRTHSRMLMWSALCFALLALNNLTVVFDLLVFDDSDLRVLRNLFSLAAVSVLLLSFIWEGQE